MWGTFSWSLACQVHTPMTVGAGIWIQVLVPPSTAQVPVWLSYCACSHARCWVFSCTDVWLKTVSFFQLSHIKWSLFKRRNVRRFYPKKGSSCSKWVFNWILFWTSLKNLFFPRKTAFPLWKYYVQVNYHQLIDLWNARYMHTNCPTVGNVFSFWKLTCCALIDASWIMRITLLDACMNSNQFLVIGGQNSQQSLFMEILLSQCNARFSTEHTSW